MITRILLLGLLTALLSTTIAVEAGADTIVPWEVIRVFLTGEASDRSRLSQKLKTQHAVTDEVEYVPLSTSGALDDSISVLRTSLDYVPLEDKSLTSMTAYGIDLYLGSADSTLVEAVVRFGRLPEGSNTVLNSAIELKSRKRLVYDAFEVTPPKVGLVVAMETAMPYIKPTDSTIVVAFLFDPVRLDARNQLWCLAIYGAEITYGPRGQEVGDGRYFCIDSETGEFHSLGSYAPLVRRINQPIEVEED